MLVSKFRTALMISLITLSSVLTYAQTRDLVTEQKYENELKAIDPSLVNYFKRGTVAMDAGDYKLADSLYTAVYFKAPNFVHVLRRLGSVRHSLGHQLEGINFAERALAIDKSSANTISLAQLLIATQDNRPEKITENLNRALRLLLEGQGLPGADPYEYNMLIAQAALQSYQEGMFKDATAYLVKNYSDKMPTHYYAAIAAAQNEEWVLAEDEITKAKELGLSEEEYQRIMDTGIHTSALIEKAKKIFLWAFIIWALIFVLLYVFGTVLSNYTLKAIEKEFKTNSSSKLAHNIRSIYSALINFAGIYYYISLPIILLLVVGLTGGIIYLFLALGRIPIQLTLILLIGACLTIYGMIRSLFLKVNSEDPGRLLKKQDAPELYALTNEVANKMGTRPIDEIRITEETDLAVYETGSWKEKMRDESKRILILGTGVLKDFKVEDFKAVIAHEYGHFSHRDTAGGAVALRVRNDMAKYYHQLFYAGQAVWWNLAFQFIRLYHFVFSKISNGATRLQEILADRVAAQTYGAVAFENGLTYVIRRNIEFVTLANKEIEEAKKTSRHLNNLYELKGEMGEEAENEIKKSMTRPTTDEDTHPSPVDRFNFIKGLGSEHNFSTDKYVRELFVDWDALTQEMTKALQSKVIS